MNRTPLVSIGIPVRNGAETLQFALDSVLNQDYPNIEIIISDNASTDSTPDIARNAAAHDGRVSYIRQSTVISGWENFRFVFEHAKGEFFLWAAADDYRDPNYISTLLAALILHPESSIAFSQLRWFSKHTRPLQGTLVDYCCKTTTIDFKPALSSLYARHFSFEIYGLIRRRALDGYRWHDTDNGADFLTLIWLLHRGPVAQTTGTTFWYFRDPEKQNPKARAKHFAYQSVLPAKDLRLSWLGSLVVCECQDRTAFGIHRILWTIRLYWAWKRGFRPHLRRFFARLRKVLKAHR